MKSERGSCRHPTFFAVDYFFDCICPLRLLLTPFSSSKAEIFLITDLRNHSTRSPAAAGLAQT